MSEAKDSTKTDASPYVADDRLQDRGGTPRKLLIFTAMFYFVVFMAFGFSSFIDDVFASGQDVIVMVFIFGSLAIFVLWAGWFLLLSGWNWASRIIATFALLAVPYLLGKVFRPVNDGDANIARFEPIWMRRPEVTAENVEPATNAVDLLTETVDDFPQFLGPTQNGVARSGIMIDDENFSSSKVLWKQPIGKAWSGFSARNGFAVTMEQRESLECVTCYRIDTGQLQWLYSHPARHQDAMNLGRLGPRATPTIHNGMVYSMGAVGNLVCLNGEDGTVVWQVDLNEILGLTLDEIEADGYLIQHEAESSLAWGRSGAPLIYQNLVIETKLIHGAWQAGIQRLLFLGSSCIYPRECPQPMPETALLTSTLEQTNEPYAVAKIAGIKLCESYNRQYGTDYRSVMPTNLYGPNDYFHPQNSHVIPGLMGRIHRAKEAGDAAVVIWGSGNAKREFLHVDDMASASVYLMNLEPAVLGQQTTPTCSHVNIGTGEDVSIRELAQILAKVIGFQGRLEFDTSKPDGTPRKLLDVGRMDALGWRYSIDLEQGLRQTYRWFCDNLANMRA